MDEPTPTATMVSIDGIRATGRHGADPGEQAMAQEFMVDVEVWVEVGGDALDSTVDYRTIVDTVRRTVAGTSFQLIEALAEGVAGAVVELPSVLRATAVVHKPGAASLLGVADVSAEVTLDAE